MEKKLEGKVLEIATMITHLKRSELIQVQELIEHELELSQTAISEGFEVDE